MKGKPIAHGFHHIYERLLFCTVELDLHSRSVSGSRRVPSACLQGGRVLEPQMTRATVVLSLEKETLKGQLI